MLLNPYRFAGRVELIDWVTTTAGEASSIDFDLPTHAEDDLLLAIVNVSDGRGGQMTTPPSGWTHNIYRGVSGANGTMVGIHKIAGASETDPVTYSLSSLTTMWAVTCFSFRGVDSTTPLTSDDVGATATANPDSNDDFPAISADPGDMVVWCLLNNGSQTIDAIPSGSTSQTSGTISGDPDRWEIATQRATSSGYPGLGTWTLSASSSTWAGGTAIVHAA